MEQKSTAVIQMPVLESALEPAPIPPEDVIAGDPQASMAILHRSADSKLFNGVWHCTPGIFNLTHPGETICLVEGEAILTPEDGEPLTIRPGECVYVAEGAVVRWEVVETVRKAFHSHDSTGALLG